MSATIWDVSRFWLLLYPWKEARIIVSHAVRPVRTSLAKINVGWVFKGEKVINWRPQEIVISESLMGRENLVSEPLGIGLPVIYQLKLLYLFIPKIF